NGHKHLLSELSPRTVRALILTVDEARDPKAGLGLEQRRNELTRVGLHATDLAGDEVYEVQPDVRGLTPLTTRRPRTIGALPAPPRIIRREVSDSQGAGLARCRSPRGET